MKIENIVFFSTQLEKVETLSIRTEKTTDDVSNEFHISADVCGEILDDNTGKSIIRIEIRNNGFIFEETKIGIFKFTDKIEDGAKGKAIQFMEVQGVRILWSYIREDIYSISSKMLPNPIMLPTIDVMKTLEKAK